MIPKKNLPSLFVGDVFVKIMRSFDPKDTTMCLRSRWSLSGLTLRPDQCCSSRKRHWLNYRINILRRFLLCDLKKIFEKSDFWNTGSASTDATAAAETRGRRASGVVAEREGRRRGVGSSRGLCAAARPRRARGLSLLS